MKIMQQAQQWQGQLQQVQEELDRITVIGSAGGGMVTAEADGKGLVRKVRIEPAVVNPADVEMLEDLVVAAVGDAQKKAAVMAQSKMSELSGGLDLPLPFKLPF